ncbi:polysaccharide pyruvyl transferase family protein [Leeuwenhoekiella sp. A2]|uniref:polysaccharide pyruvyl transferase family protein n=1 Tax=Leeuwenhoekiella sp. A2 TaxID=3141460 RepID=UPI003A7F970C
MKIGIITFWESNNNYGQILQLFAMQTILKRMGHEPFLIKYHRVPPVEQIDFLTKLKNINLLRSIKYRLQAPVRKKSLLLDEKRSFSNFKNEFICFGEKDYYNLNALQNDPPKADAYITGSDQVWNHTFKVSAEAFLLGFGAKSIKRIAYAASYGVKAQDGLTQHMFKKYLENFSGISVREKSGLELTKKLGFKANWVLDPTMLFTAKQWIELLKLGDIGDSPGVKKDQIFMYMLGNSEIKDKEKFIIHAKQKTDFKIIHATANNDFTGNAYPTIPEWIYYISTSKLVITTSFHGMIFCILNNTNFIVLPNTGHAEGMNERIESMLNFLGMGDHIMTCFSHKQFEAILKKEINWEDINQDLLKWREESILFLTEKLI